MEIETSLARQRVRSDCFETDLLDYRNEKMAVAGSMRTYGEVTCSGRNGNHTVHAALVSGGTLAVVLKLEMLDSESNCCLLRMVAS